MRNKIIVELKNHVCQNNNYYYHMYIVYIAVGGMQGLSEGITQTTKRCSGPEKHFVWNFPLDVTFKSTNPFGCKFYCHACCVEVCYMYLNGSGSLLMSQSFLIMSLVTNFAIFKLA